MNLSTTWAASLLLIGSLANAWIIIAPSLRRLRSYDPKKLQSVRIFQELNEDGGWDEPDPTLWTSNERPRSVSSGKTDVERDLFIPIFALVSILGLLGSYGYEMLRLATRGELYLPWTNN